MSLKSPKTTTTKTRRTRMRSTARRLRRRLRRRKLRQGPNRRVCYIFAFLLHEADILQVTTRHSGSDSDSDYGSKSKKKKKAKTSEIRVSSRGGRIPNYVDDVQDFEQFDEDVPEGTYVEAVSEPHDEIEAVLGHCRDEGHEDDPEDDWTRNIVRMLVVSFTEHSQLTTCYHA